MQDPDTSHLTGAAPQKQNSMAPKKKTRTKYPKDYKREVIKRVREAQKTGSESIEAIAKDLKINATNIHNWLRGAKGKPKAGKKKARRTNGVARATTTVETPTIDTALAQVEQALSTLTRVRDAYRQVFGG